MNEMVYIDEYGLRGSNFYWHKYADKGLSKEDILSVGLTDDRVQVNKKIVKPLLAVQSELQMKGYGLFIKEGYRSKSLYEIVYQRRCEKFGKEETDRLLNMATMPHAQGTSVDVALWDLENDKEIYLRRTEDGIDACFFGFYENKADEQSRRLYDLQKMLAEVMKKHGFVFGSKREYFHFDYRPDEKSNYEFSDSHVTNI
jgi:D-alanyl-D-alanine dipeptidase